MVVFVSFQTATQPVSKSDNQSTKVLVRKKVSSFEIPREKKKCVFPDVFPQCTLCFALLRIGRRIGSIFDVYVCEISVSPCHMVFLRLIIYASKFCYMTFYI